MVIVPRCHVCANDKPLSLRKAFRCCQCKRYICAKHNKPKKIKPEDYFSASFCVVCNPKTEGKGASDVDETPGRKA